MSLKIRGILVLTVGSLLGLGLSLGGAVLESRNAVEDRDIRSREQAQLFAEVVARVKRDYVEPLDDDELFESAIRGMVADLDAHSQYLDKGEYEDIRVNTAGMYSGVGLEVSARNGDLVVVSPIDGSPAQRAGILSGDRILAIEGATVEEDGLRETIRRLRGRKGTRVSLTVLRRPGDEVLVFDLRRDTIHVASVRHELLEEGIGYLRVSQFTDATAEELGDAIDAMGYDLLDREGIPLAAVILDLRNNPGGTLDAAVDVADLFLDAGVIVTADGRTPEARFRRDADRGDILDGAPMAVLVNQGSASAAEIVAGALQDHDRAVVVGTGTFGKGLVQTVMPLSRGRAIKLTTSRYYTPSGDSIQETGIAPDIRVEGSSGHPGFDLGDGLDREGDAQFARALERLKSRRILQSRAP